MALNKSEELGEFLYITFSLVVIFYLCWYVFINENTLFHLNYVEGSYGRNVGVYVYAFEAIDLVFILIIFSIGLYIYYMALMFIINKIFNPDSIEEKKLKKDIKKAKETLPRKKYEIERKRLRLLFKLKQLENEK